MKLPRTALRLPLFDPTHAGMAKLADAADLKSADPKGLWGFKSPSRHHLTPAVRVTLLAPWCFASVGCAEVVFAEVRSALVCNARTLSSAIVVNLASHFPIPLRFVELANPDWCESSADDHVVSACSVARFTGVPAISSSGLGFPTCRADFLTILDPAHRRKPFIFSRLARSFYPLPLRPIARGRASPCRGLRL